MKTIAIPVETKTREFNGKVLLAYELIKRGFMVILGSSQELYYNLHKIKPDMFIINNGDYTHRIYKRLLSYKNAGGKIVLLENEGGVFSDVSILKMRLDNRMVNIVDYYFAWSKRTADYVINERIFEPNKVIVTGHPTFDFLTFPLNKIYKSEVDEIKKEFPNLILINTNFSLFNSAIPGQYDKYISPGGLEYYGKLFNAFVQLTRILATKFPQYDFVLRPHPSENETPYITELKGIKNAYVRKDRSAQSMIFASKVVIQNSCTTGIEAALGGQKVISYRPIKDERFDIELPNLCSVQAFNVEEIQQMIKNTESIIPVNIKEINIGDRFNNFNEMASTKIASFISLIKFPNSLGRIRNNGMKGNVEQIRPYLYNWWIKEVLPKKYKDEMNYIMNKFPGTSKRELETILYSINNINKDSLQLKIDKVKYFKGVFSISL